MSSQTSSLYTALLAFQKAVGPVKKDASNPAFRSKYATLQSVLETVEEPLSDNGLVLLQRLDGLDGHTIPLLITEIVHAASGEKVASRVAVVCKDPNDPQKLGGALTYYRRYSLLALLGLAPEDDDGNAASKPAPAPQRGRPEPIQPMYPVESAPQERPAPSPKMRVTDNPRRMEDAPVTPDSWTTVWVEARAQGINDRQALARFLGVDNPASLDPRAILAKLRDEPAPQAPAPPLPHASIGG